MTHVRGTFSENLRLHPLSLYVSGDVDSHTLVVSAVGTFTATAFPSAHVPYPVPYTKESHD